MCQPSGPSASPSSQGPGVGAASHPLEFLPRGLLGGTCHVLSGAEAWPGPEAVSEKQQVRVPGWWHLQLWTAHIFMFISRCGLLCECWQPWPSSVGGVRMKRDRTLGRVSLVKTSEGQTGTCPEGGCHGPL